MTKQVQRRRGTATQHTSFTGAEGELSVNTTNKSVHVHDNVTAGGFEAARADMDNVTSSSILTAAGITATTTELNYVDGVTSAIQTQLDGKAGTASPTFTGTLTTANLTATGTTTLAGASTSADITFGDNDKAIFGAGSDLQIYHDGSRSIIQDNGTGNLRIQANNLELNNADNSENYLFAANNGAVTLYYDNAEKLNTTATGVSISGNIAASDGLTSSGGVSIQNDAASFSISNAAADRYQRFRRNSSNSLILDKYNGSTTTNTAKFDQNGDISFYEDTGSTPKFFWDASTERLGLGTTTPQGDLSISDGGAQGLEINANTSGDTRLFVYNRSTNAEAPMQIRASEVDFSLGGSNRMVVSSTGIDVTGTVTADGLTVDGTGTFNNNVGVVVSSATPSIRITETDTTDENTQFIQASGTFRIRTASDDYSTTTERLRIDHGTGDISFFEDTGSTPKFFWDASAESLGIGTSSPSETLDVSGNIRALGANSRVMFGPDGFEAGIKYATDASLQIAARSGETITFTNGNDGAERMRIDSSGNVGIGTTTSAGKLTVDGTVVSQNAAQGAGNVQLQGYGATSYINHSGTGSLIFRMGTGYTERMRIDSSGNVSISSTDAEGAKLKVADTQDAVTYPLFLQNRTNTGNSAVGIRFIATGSSVSDGQFAAIRATNALGTGSTANDLEFLTCGSGGTPAVRMRIDSSGDVIINHNTNNAKLEFKDQSNSTGMMVQQIGASGAPALRIYDTAASSERMRIDSSGNLMVGHTSAFSPIENGGSGVTATASGQLFAGHAGPALYVNREDSNGDIAVFRKDGSNVGNIGVLSSDNFYFGGSVSGHAGLIMDGSSIVPLSALTRTDNAIDLGDGSYRFDDIYATNGTIQTSDRNEKQDIAELTDAEQRVAVAAKGLLRKFRWKDAVAEKGDEARTHFGIIAQDLQAAFAAEGLDAGDYAMFISSTWTDEETGEERTRMGVRYSELLAFIIAAI